MNASRAPVDRKRVIRDEDDDGSASLNAAKVNTQAGAGNAPPTASATNSGSTVVKKRPRLSTKYDFAESAEAILKKFSKDPPSLELHVYETHFKFGTQEGVLPRNSPALKEFLQYVGRGEIAPAAVEVFRDSGIKFYEGCVILRIIDHRNENERGKVQGTGHGQHQNHQHSPSKQEVSSGNTSNTNPGTTGEVIAKSYNIVLQPSTMSIWHDLLCMADTSQGRLTDQFTQLIESEILTLTTRNVDLRVPKREPPQLHEKTGRDVTLGLIKRGLKTQNNNGTLTKKEAYKMLFTYRPEVTVPARSLHEDEAHGRHGTEYEELMLILDERQNSLGTTNSNNQFMRLNFVEQLRKKRERLRLQQQQAHQQQQAQQVPQQQANPQQQAQQQMVGSQSHAMNAAQQRKAIPPNVAAKMTQAQLLRAQQQAAQQAQQQQQNVNQMTPAQVQAARGAMAGGQQVPQEPSIQTPQRPLSQASGGGGAGMGVGGPIAGVAGGPNNPAMNSQAQLQQRYANNSHVLEMQARAQAQMQKTQAKAAAAANMARLTPQQQQQLQRQILSQQQRQQHLMAQQQQQQQSGDRPGPAMGNQPQQQQPFTKEQLMMLQQQQMKMQQQKNQMAMQSNFTVRPTGQGQGPGGKQMAMNRGAVGQDSVNVHRSPSTNQAFPYSPGSPQGAPSPANQRVMATPKQQAGQFGHFNQVDRSNMNMGNMNMRGTGGNMNMGNMNMGNPAMNMGNMTMGNPAMNMANMNMAGGNMNMNNNMNMAGGNNMAGFNMDMGNVNMGAGGSNMDMGMNDSNFMNFDFGAMNQMNMGSPQMQQQQQQMLNNLGFRSPMMDNNSNRQNR